VERSPELPDENPLTLLPDWCCEILSPSTAHDDKRLKLPLYAQAGVSYVWLIDPARRWLDVYHTTAERLPVLVASRHNDDVGPVVPFAQELRLGSWWLPASRREM